MADIDTADVETKLVSSTSEEAGGCKVKTKEEAENRNKS